MRLPWCVYDEGENELFAEAERKVRAAFPVLRRVSEYSTDPVASADAKTALREIGEE